MKILVVDDEKDLGFLIKTHLERAGHIVILDSDGISLSHIGNDPPDLILLDLNLKNKDGGDLCTQLKLKNITKNIPVILVSGLMDLKQISQMCGAQDYLMKPFDVSQLLQVIAKHATHPLEISS